MQAWCALLQAMITRVTALALAAATMTSSAWAIEPCRCGRDHAGPCVSSASTYGYQPVQWRRWPEETHGAPAAWRPQVQEHWPAPPQAPQRGHSAPTPASPDQLFENEPPATRPAPPKSSPLPPPLQPKSKNEFEDPFKDDAPGTSPAQEGTTGAAPAATPRIRQTINNAEDRQVGKYVPPRNTVTIQNRPLSTVSTSDDETLPTDATITNFASDAPTSSPWTSPSVRPRRNSLAISGVAPDEFKAAEPAQVAEFTEDVPQPDASLQAADPDESPVPEEPALLPSGGAALPLLGNDDANLPGESDAGADDDLEPAPAWSTNRSAARPKVSAQNSSRYRWQGGSVLHKPLVRNVMESSADNQQAEASKVLQTTAVEQPSSEAAGRRGGNPLRSEPSTSEPAIGRFARPTLPNPLRAQ